MFLSAWASGWRGTALLRQRHGVATGHLSVALVRAGQRCGGLLLPLKGAATARASSRAKACVWRPDQVRPDQGPGERLWMSPRGG